MDYGYISCLSLHLMFFFPPFSPLRSLFAAAGWSGLVLSVPIYKPCIEGNDIMPVLWTSFSPPSMVLQPCRTSGAKTLKIGSAGKDKVNRLLCQARRELFPAFAPQPYSVLIHRVTLIDHRH
jgi:hypothetical protein